MHSEFCAPYFDVIFIFTTNIMIFAATLIFAMGLRRIILKRSV
jgi:hypothetical protein